MNIESTTLQGSMKRLFPDQEPDQVLAELLLEWARRNLVKYRAMARGFESKHGTDFGTFRQRILDSKPDSETEQDYFDWELAVTGIEDMQDEISRLQNLGAE
jgi:hypothetical protein